MKKPIICFFALFLFAHLNASLVFDSIIWQKSASEKPGPKLRFKTTKILKFEKNTINPSKIRIIIKLKNTGKIPIKAAVIRCAFYMKIKKLNSKEKAIWSVPLELEERRVSIIKPKKTIQVKTTPISLINYLKRLKNSGFWLEKIKTEIMIEPRKGDNLKDNFTTSKIKVIYD